MTFDEHDQDDVPERDAPEHEAWRGDVHRVVPDDADAATLLRLRAISTSDTAPVGLASRVEAKTLRTLRNARHPSPEAIVAFAVVVYLAFGTQVPAGWSLAVVAGVYAIVGFRSRVAEDAGTA